MSLASGMGSVTVLNATLAATPQFPKIAGTKHCNGIDTWIVTQDDWIGNSFRAYSLTATGINTVAVFSSFTGTVSGHGYLKFSPSGKKMAGTNYGNQLHLYDFSTSTGSLTNGNWLQSTMGGCLGVEFSPDETKLYCAFNGGSLLYSIYQYDLCQTTSTSIAASAIGIAPASLSSRYGMQLAQNGKIYVARDSLVLSVINDPNLSGSSCNFSDLGQLLPGSAGNIHTLPNFVSSYFYHPPQPAPFTNSLTPTQSCRTVSFTAPPNPTTTCSLSNYSVTGILWNFGDLLSGSSNTSSINTPVHTFSGPGTFTAMLIFKYECGADTLRQPITIAGPSLTINTNSVTCAGPGSATVTTIGGTGPFNYTWTPTSQSGSVAVNLISGNYSVSVFDVGAGCLTKTTTSIGSNMVYTGTVSSNNLLCNSVNVATANIQVNGGSGISSYTWSGTAQTTSLVTGLAASIYTVTVTDQISLCTLTKTFQVTQPSLFTVSVSVSSPSNCVGGSTSLNANGNGGIPAYTYTWTAGPSQQGYTVAETTPGTYSYTVASTDANNCTAMKTITLAFTSAPVLTVNHPTICTNYIASLTISGANSYTWQPGNYVGSTFTASPPSTKIYSITGYLAGCTSTNVVTATITVVPPPSLTTALSSNTICTYAFNGSPNTITLTSSGASSYTLYTPYHISNSNPSGPSSQMSSMPPYTSGVSTATLEGSNGFCTVSSTYSFTILPNPTLTISSPTPVICAGESFTYTNQGATSYTWNSTTPGLTTYSTGQVAVANPSITSVFSAYGGSLGCNSAIQTTTITILPLPEIELPLSPTVCIGSSVKLNAGGTASSFTWSPYVGLNSVLGSSVLANPNANQTYTVLGILNTCTDVAMVTVSVLPLPVAIAKVISDKLCANSLVSLKGSGGLIYNWDGPQDLKLAGQTATFVASSSNYSGSYNLIVTDSNGCKNKASIDLTVYNLPNGDLFADKKEACVPFKSEFKSSFTSKNVIGNWSLENNSYSSKNFSHTFINPGTYIITGHFRDSLTTCASSNTFVVQANPNPVADFSILPEKPIENLDEVIFTNTSSGEQQSKWNWYFANNQGYQSENKNTSYLFMDAGIYPVVMVVKNTWGCSDTIIKAVKVEADLAVYVPNVFTPNGDDLNEVFLPVTRALKQYELSIFDRWGTKVFSTTNSEAGWDGTFRGELCKTDVYVWKIVLSSVNGEMKTLTGHVTLSR